MSKKKVTPAEMQKMIKNLKQKRVIQKREQKRPAAKTTTEDIIALKKIKLLKEAKLNPPKKEMSFAYEFRNIL